MSSSSVPYAVRASLVDQRFASAAFPLSVSLLPDIGEFAEQVVSGWELDHLGFVAAGAAIELAVWLQNHAPSPAMRVNLTWAAPLLHVEVLDQGPDIPNTGAEVHDAAMAIRLLVQPGVQWGASLDARGRCLWVTVDTASYESPVPIDGTDAGPS